MSITYSDHITAILCPQCSAIPCRCSKLLVELEAWAQELERMKHREYDRRQQELRDAL